MSNVSDAVQEAADRLARASADGVACAPVRALLPPGDLDAAYAVQKINTDRAIESGRRLVGRKIGLTSLAVQKQLGVDQPDYGLLFADMAVEDGLEIAVGQLIQPKVEAEIAFIFGQSLESEDLTIADILSAIDYVVPAIEIVDSRIADWDIRIVDTIADNASAGLFVLGGEPRLVGDFDPRLCGMVMERRGEPVAVGAGAACLGSPYNAVLWLARKMASVGEPLRGGDIVLSGALGPMVAAKPGDAFEARINGLGSVRAAFAA